MPTIGPFHTTYWAVSDTIAPTPPGAGQPGYPMWQSGPTTVVLGAIFGGITPFLERAWMAVRWWGRWGRRVFRLDGEQRAVMERVIAVLDTPHYRVAQTAVRGTATTIGFNRPEAWIHLGRHIKANPGHAENTYRHLEAYRRVREAVPAIGSTVTQTQLHLTVELAYQGFAATGR